MTIRRMCATILLLLAGCTPLRDGPLGSGTAATDVPDTPDADVSSTPDRPPSSDGSADDDTRPASDVCPEGMVRIAAATFQMGSNGLQSMPVHAVRLDAYCLDRTEVTVAAYQACAGCSAPGTDASCNSGVVGRAAHPINCVTFGQAAAYCASVGKRLPTEAQWEYAARGPDGRSYPWGSAEPTTQPCWQQSSTCAVGTHPASDSPFGVSDLAGDVAEWTADWFGAYRDTGAVQDNPTGVVSGTERATRGGDWALQRPFANGLQTTQRASFPPDTSSPRVGFRCAQ